MTIVFAALFLLLFWKCKTHIRDWNTDYMNQRQTTIVNGYFIGLVAMSHFKGYVKLTSHLDKAYLKISSYMTQFIVAMFLFYSGYGIMTSIMTKSADYVKRLPVHRILKILVHFDIAVTCYLIINLLYGKPLTLSRVLLSYIGWRSLGNSNWYIFAILLLWIITYLVYRFIKTDDYYSLNLIVLICTTALVIILKSQVQHWWYDTLFCFPMGMFYALLKPKIDSFFRKSNLRWLLVTLIFLGLVFVTGRSNPNKQFIQYEVWMLSFTLLTVLITMKFYVNNGLLYWMGKHLFEIYIYMRIPMMVFKPIFAGHNYWYFLASVIGTAILAFVFSYFNKKLDQTLFK